MSKQEVILCESLETSLSRAIEQCPHDKLFILTDEHTRCLCLPALKELPALKDAIETLNNPQFFRNCVYAHERNQRTLQQLSQPYTKQETQQTKYDYSAQPYDLGPVHNALAESNRLRRERDENEKIMDEVKRGLRY